VRIGSKSAIGTDDFERSSKSNSAIFALAVRNRSRAGVGGPDSNASSSVGNGCCCVLRLNSFPVRRLYAEPGPSLQYQMKISDALY